MKYFWCYELLKVGTFSGSPGSWQFLLEAVLRKLTCINRICTVSVLDEQRLHHLSSTKFGNVFVDTCPDTKCFHKELPGGIAHDLNFGSQFAIFIGECISIYLQISSVAGTASERVFVACLQVHLSRRNQLETMP